MSKIKKLRKKFTAFASQLTPDECREQLVLAYLQMEKCQQVLRGEEVEPVTMMDNGESSDLELFYRCKKVAEELAYLNGIFQNHPDVIALFVRFLGDSNDSDSKLRFAKGQEVWYMFGDRVQHSTIEYPMRDVDGVTIYKTKLGHDTAECETFCSLEELLENLKKTVNE